MGPEVFTPANARTYGAYLGRRYREKLIVWILGGDRDPETPEHLAIVRAMAVSIRAETGGRQLMTYHPMGGSGSWRPFHRDAWLGFNMFQSGHERRNNPNHERTAEAHRLAPVKPVVNGEPAYEDHPID